MFYFIIFLLTCATAWSLDRQEFQQRKIANYTRIQILQDRVLQSDATQLVKSLHDYVLSFHASSSGTVSQCFEELSQIITLNLATVAVLNTTSSTVPTLEHLTRLQHAVNKMKSNFISLKRRNPPAYWVVCMPFRSTIKSIMHYRSWQLQNLQKDAIIHRNGSLLLERTFEKIRETAILLEASTYMLSQLKLLGFQKLYCISQPILANLSGPLLRNPLSEERAHSIEDQLLSIVNKADDSWYRYSEIVLMSFLVVSLSLATVLLLPTMCHDYLDGLLLGRCAFYLLGMTWFHMMVFFLFFSKLRRDFEI